MAERYFDVRVAFDTADYESVKGVLTVRVWAGKPGAALAAVVRKVPPLWKITDSTVEEVGCAE